MRDRLPLAIILAAFLTFSILFNQTMPYRQAGFYTASQAMIPDIGAPDERQHANYVKWLMDGKGFPVIKPGDPNLAEMYQAHQPPLFYLIAAGWSKIFGLDPTEESSGFTLRLLNSFIGMAMLLGIYYGIKWGTSRKDIALAATAFAALLPTLVMLCSGVTNDPLSYAICTWSLAMMVLGTVNGWNIKLLLITAVLLAMGIYTKTTMLSLFPVAAIAVWMAGRKKSTEEPQSKVSWLMTGGMLLVLPFVLALPWLVRSVNLYGDPFALGVFQDAFANSPKASTFIGISGFAGYWLNWVLWWVLRSFVGVFGYMDIYFFEFRQDDSGTRFYLGILLLLGLLTLVGAFYWKKLVVWCQELQRPSPNMFLALTLTHLAIIVLFFIRFNITYFQAQSRYIYPAITGFALFPAMGVVALLKDRSKWAWVVILILFAGLCTFSIQTMQDGFAARMAH